MSKQSVGKLQSTYLLVAHGSRDPRPQKALAKLAKLCSERLAMLTPTGIATRSRLTRSEALVGSATLEGGPTALHEQICQFADYTLSLGLAQVQVMPLFLLPGVHVKEDVPAEVAIAQQVLKDKIAIDLRPHLGCQTCSLAKWIASQKTSVALQTNWQIPCAAKWILLSHGTRRTGGNSTVEAMAEQAGATAAYWSVPPSLEEQVSRLVHHGHQEIGILPYCLFAGGLTDAIAQRVEQLKQQFPQVKFYLANPLEASVELADLIVNLIAK